MPNSIAELINSSRVIVCCGSGGVGKTTTSAAIALEAAARGKKTAVITIDPAKRLATSLGLETLSPRINDLTHTVSTELQRIGAPPLAGSFYAVMPDTAQTFDHLLESLAKGRPGLVERIAKTSIYKIFTQDFSGTNEYMAMEKLYELYQEHDFDLIVLDTPPSANTKLFLEAPHIFAEFFDEKVIRWFITPGSRILAAGLKKALEVLEKLTGHGFISELLEFTSALFELRDQFMKNLQAIHQCLHSPDVAFIMVTSPERISRHDTLEFAELIQNGQYQFRGFVMNRTLTERLKIIDLNQNFKLPDLPDSDVQILNQSFDYLLPYLKQESESSNFLKRVLKNFGSDAFLQLVPEQSSDVHSIEALYRLSRIYK